MSIEKKKKSSFLSSFLSFYFKNHSSLLPPHESIEKKISFVFAFIFLFILILILLLLLLLQVVVVGVGV